MKRDGSAALERYVFDLSSTEWADLPDYEVINAAVFAARGSVHVYPDHSAARVRELLAGRHALDPEQIVLGNGLGISCRRRPSRCSRPARNSSRPGRRTLSIR